MKQSKTYKLILTLATAFFMMLSCLLLFSAKTVSADDLQHFTGTYKEAKYENNSAVFTLGNNKTVIFSNWLIANELALDLTLGEDVNSIKVSFETKPFDVNGNVDQQKEVFTTVKHNLSVKFDGTPVSFNETNGTTTLDSVDKQSLKIYFTVEDNVLKAAVKDQNSFIASSDNKYLVRDIGGCVAENITITADVKTGSQSTIAINSIDQNYTDLSGAYKQTFELENDEIKQFAKARILVNESAYVSTETGYQLKAFKGTQYAYTFNAYSVLKEIKSTDLYVDQASHLWLSNENKPTTAIFREEGNLTLSVRDADNVYETFTFVVSDKNSVVNSAPVYKDDAQAEKQIESFKIALQEATLKEYNNGTKYCIRLGEKVKLPSFESLVHDDFTAYSQLKYTVHYRTPDTTGTSSKLEIPTDKAGRYEFFVVFEDVNGEKMSTDDFYTFDDNDEQKRNMGVYGAYVFSFEIQDNAPINITAVNQINGYVGTRYTVSKFNVSASGYTPTYELYYNAKADELPLGDWEKTWIKIPVASEISEADVMPEGFTYEDIQNIDYDGQLSFTPDRTGKFVVKCTVSSNSSVRSASATASVEVRESPTIVKPVNTWLKDNVWSVVFLSAGTVCLIIVIILLFVQPKEKIEEETKTLQDFVFTKSCFYK